MGKQKPKGWLDKFDSTVVKSDATSRPTPGPVFLGNPYAKEMAKRQTYISPYDAKQKASPAMQQVFAEKADAQAKKKRIRNFLEEQQDVLGKAEMLSLIPTPFTEVVGGAAGLTNAAISAALAGQDFSEGNYASALGNFATGALGVGAGSIGMRGGLNNVIDDLLPAKGPKNFMTGKPMSSTPGTLGTLKPLEPHQEIGFHAIGDFDYVSDRELKEAYEEALDKFQLTNYRPNVDPFLDHDVEKALALNVRMKFADRLPKFTNNNYTAAVHAEDPLFFDGRGPYSERFFNQQGYDLSKLDPQEKALMSAYQHGYDAYFNKRPNVHKLPTTLKDYFGELSDQFNTAVQKNKINKDITLNRSVGDYVLDYWDPVANKSLGRGLRSELQVGDVYKDAGFMSTSLPHYDYGIGKFKDKIIVPGGGVQSYAFPNATSYGQFMGEQEVILPKGLIRRVEDVPEPGQVITSILNPYKNGGWLEKYNDGGPVQENYNDYSVSAPKGFVGEGFSNVGRNYSPAWGGQFEDGGEIPQLKPGGRVITKREDFEPWWNWASRQAGDLGHRQDAYGKVGDLYAYYAGQPLHYNVLEYSQYKPTNSKDPNAKYISINDPKFRQEIFDQYQNTFVKGDLKSGYPKKINDNTYAVSGYPPHDKKLAERAKKLNVRGLDLMRKEHTTSAIGHYYLSKGKDDKGEYISYYDVFDQGTGPNGGGVGETLGLTKPFEIYDRIYLDPKTGKPKMAMGGSMPGAVGFTYARTINPAPSNGPYAKKTKASAQNGIQTTPNNSETDLDIANYVNRFFESNKNTIDQNTVSSIKKTMGNYINSPLYAQRQLNHPEQYIKGNPANPNDVDAPYFTGFSNLDEQKKYETYIAKNKKEERLRVLNTLPVDINPLGDTYSNFYNSDAGKITLSKKNTPQIVTHELSHGIARVHPGMFYGEIYPESDRFNTKHIDSINSKRNKPFSINTGLNASEVNQFVNLAKPLVESSTDKFTVSKDEHHDKSTRTPIFAGEQYGDLNAVRYLLFSKGITKSFGENLDKTKLEKALKNKQIKDDPNFKRLHYRYGTDNLIKLNNTIAANNPQQGMPMAQNGIDIPEGEDISYTSENPAFDAASLSIRQGLINSIPELSSPAIDININQRNLGAEHTFTHQPGSSVFSDEPSESYMLKRTVSPYTTDEDVRLNTLMPNSPRDVNFISNYAGARPDLTSEYPTSVPYEGEKHWNIDRFAIDPQFSSSYGALENTQAYTDKTQQRRNTLADMYKYFMLQNKGNRDVAWKQANEFMTKEIDPRISGPMYDKLYGDESLSLLGGGITDFVDDKYVSNFNSLMNQVNLPENERSYQGKNFVKNPVSAQKAKDLAIDWLVNYKKMSPKQAETYYKKLPKKQNGGEMKYYQEGLDFRPKTISKNGSVIKDDRGQWAHPGEITEIGSNQITMQGVPYPVLGISDTGDTQMMYPNQDYTYEGSSVTEYPMMKEGGALQLIKLDQLTNFTNYNTKQPGGWLSKYE